MQTFITHKLDINIRGNNQYTALMWAAYRGQLSCVQLLLAHGADNDLRSRWGVTALMYAALRNYPDIIAELLRHGADDQIQDEYGENALTNAKEENNHQDAIRMLTAWKEKSVDQEMMTAAADGKARLVTGLIIAGANINTRNDRGETGLDLGVNFGYRDVVQTFLDHGLSASAL